MDRQELREDGEIEHSEIETVHVNAACTIHQTEFGLGVAVWCGAAGAASRSPRSAPSAGSICRCKRVPNKLISGTVINYR